MQTDIRSFVPIQKIGEGSFASVYKVKRVCDNQIYALKKIRINHLPQKARENSLNQVRLLASIDSPYIARYHQAFFDQKIECLCIVMQFAEQGDLRKLINKSKNQKKMMTQIEIWKLMIHLLHGLKILHTNDILHRDLKCENILIGGDIYKIGDMNVSKINKYGLVETQTGTPYYASPEVWQDQPYNEKSDIWSLGCILYEIATFRPPFSGNNMNDLHKNIMRGTYHPIPKIYSNELADIIYSCLKLSAKERPGVNQLLQNWSLKMYENICIDYKVKDVNSQVEMLKTINMPKNMKELNKQLPKSKYNTATDVKTEKTPESVGKEKDGKSAYRTEKVHKSDNIQPKIINSIIDKNHEQGKVLFPEAIPEAKNINDNKDSAKKVKSEVSDEEIALEHPIKPIEITNKQPSSSSNKITDNSQSSKETGSANTILDIPEKIVNKKTCSLQEIEEHAEKKVDPEYEQLFKKAQASNSVKSIEEIQSFNRLIERIKSSSKTQRTEKVEKIEVKKPRRTLKDIDNKSHHVDHIKKSKSKSMRRTERSISMSRQKSKEILLNGGYGKVPSVLGNKNSSGSTSAAKMNYKICCYSDRKNSKNENKVVDKYQLGPAVNNKYTKILEDAKSYLKKSASKPKKLF